jgi:hypothetical protein
MLTRGVPEWLAAGGLDLFAQRVGALARVRLDAQRVACDRRAADDRARAAQR